MKRLIAAIMTTVALFAAAMAAGPLLGETARNAHGFTLRLDLYNFVNGNWRGDAVFALEQCPQATCFHLTGKVLLPLGKSGGNEGAFSIPHMACDLYFLDVPHNDMDSGDYQVTPISRDKKKNGCAKLPKGITGVYKQTSGGGYREDCTGYRACMLLRDKLDVPEAQ